jgi:hypothetical protein
MSTETKPEKSAPAAKAPDRQPITVLALHFNRPNGVSIPGGGAVVNSIDARPKTHADGWKILLLPWIRMYQVTTVPLSSAKKPIQFLVPESWAIAEIEA